MARPYAFRVVRCTAFGTAADGAEEWSTGFYMGHVGQDANPIAQDAADFFLTTWLAFQADVNVGITNRVKTVGVRVNMLTTAGLTDLSQNFYAYPTSPVAGAGGATNMHPQLTLVASMQARPDRGLGAKGRMFLPGVSHSIGSTGHITSANATGVCTGVKNLFNAMNATFTISGNVINASKGRNLGIGGDAPVNRNVEDVLIGDVYDTQRRRRNQIQEAYVSQAVTVSA